MHSVVTEGVIIFPLFLCDQWIPNVDSVDVKLFGKNVKKSELMTRYGGFTDLADPIACDCCQFSVLTYAFDRLYEGCE